MLQRVLEKAVPLKYNLVDVDYGFLYHVKVTTLNLNYNGVWRFRFLKERKIILHYLTLIYLLAF